MKLGPFFSGTGVEENLDDTVAVEASDTLLRKTSSEIQRGLHA